MASKLVPRVGIGLFLLNPQNKFLIGQRLGSLGAGTYGLPGGHLELHESFEAAAARELAEETGIVLPAEKIRFLTCTNLPRFEGRHYVTVFMGARVGEGVVPRVMEPDKCKSWEWMGWEDAEQSYKKVVDVRRKTGDVNAKLKEGQGRNLFEAFYCLFEQRPGFRIENHL